VFQRRIDGSEVFYRTWTQYAAGFGRRDGEFWLGNDHIAALTASKQYRLRVDLGDFRGAFAYAEYSHFKVGNASTRYMLSSLGTYSGTAGDSLWYHLYYPFYTYDRDNSFNCARDRHGAWWYDYCAHSNLNGLYNGTNRQGLEWQYWQGSPPSLRFTEMKLRPN